MIFDPLIETRPPDEQLRIDAEQYRRQISYLYEHSEFYRRKLAAAGFRTAHSVGGLNELQHLPFTEKDELRKTQAEQPPFGEHLACDPRQLVRIYSTSGTTGTPCIIGLTRRDLEMHVENVARGYSAAGLTPGERVILPFNSGPTISGATFGGFDRLGCTSIALGTGNTEQLVAAIRRFSATVICCTPSHGIYLHDWCQDRGIDPRTLGLRLMVTGGEPGGGEPLIRGQLAQSFACQVREAMGVSDISVTIWAEDTDDQGMHLMARGFVHVELIDPATDAPLPFEDGARGELVYTALQREAMPLLRFRSRDQVVVNLRPNPTGRTGPRIRCIGRTDDMLIVRGQNLFPSAVRAVLEEFAPTVGTLFQIRPRRRGVAQAPPLPIAVELANGVATPPPDLRERLIAVIRSRLTVTTDIELLPYGTLPRTDGKTQLVDFSHAEEDQREANPQKPMSSGILP